MPLSPKRAGSVAYSLTMFLVVSMLAGLLVAGLVVPFAGMAGVGSRATAAEMQNIPTEFTTPPQPERSNIYMANGDKLATFYEQDRVYEPLSKIAPIMQTAQVAIEDHRYFTHGALDIQGTLRALVRNTAGGSTQGGSSITQQYVKMVRIEQAQLDGNQKAIAGATDETYARKIQELRYAIALEKQLSKDQILERYLNIAYYGDGSYGVEAAARHYFSTTAAKLTLAQAAMLAGMVQNPNGTDPVLHPVAAIDRRDVVLNRMAELNIITPAQATAAKKTKFDKDKVKSTRNGCLGTKYPFLCNYVYRSLLADPALGSTPDERKNAILRGGLNVQTQLDPDAQDKAQTAVSDFISAKDPVISTMSEIQPGTGLIVAMAQSRPVMGSDTKKGQTYYNYAASAAYGGAEGYQSGSTMKAVTIAAALDAGYPLDKRYDAKSPLNMSGTTWKSCDGVTQKTSNYKPRNDVGHSTNIDMRTAAEFSVNTYFLQLEKDVGVCNVAKMAKKLGIERADGTDITKDSNSLAFTLGISEIAPISLAEAYATFAARGMRCDPIIVKKITNRSGKSLAVPSANCKQVISQDVADGVSDILSSVMKGSATAAHVRLPDGRPEAGKTGTIEDNAAVWFAGYTPELAGVSMIAKDKRRKPFINNGRSGIKGYKLPYSGSYLNGTGGGDAGKQIWRPAMTEALKGVAKTAFHSPSTDVQQGKQVTMPDISGMSADQAKVVLAADGIDLADKYTYDDYTPFGQFMGFSQTGGKVSQFGSVYAMYSKGQSPASKQAAADAQQQQAADAAAARSAAAQQQANAQAKSDRAQAKRDAAAQARSDRAQAKKDAAQAKKDAAAQAKKDAASNKATTKPTAQPTSKATNPPKPGG